jgi:hypothetical protein
MATRSIRLPNGKVINDVPDSFTDEEAINDYLGRHPEEITTAPAESPAVEEQEQVSDPSVAVDFGRVFLNTAQKIGKWSPGSGWEPGEDFKPYEFTAREGVTPLEKERLTQYLPEKMYNAFWTPEGDIKEPETLTGQVVGVGAEIGTLVAGSVLGGRAKLIKALPTVVGGLTTGVAVDQVLADPSENLFNFLEEAGWAGSAVQEISSYIATDEDDTEAEKRIKLLGEGLFLSSVVLLAGGVAKVSKLARDKFKKSYTDLTSSEKGELFLDHVKDIKEQSPIKRPEIEYNETAKGIAQVAQQNSSKLRRFLNQVFNSRGYWTPKAFHAFEDAQYAQRAAVGRAEHISNRLKIELDNLSSLDEAQAVNNKVQELLTSDLSFIKKQSKEASIVDLMDEGLTKEVAESVYEARMLIDDLSKAAVNSNAVPLELKEAIAENTGQYLRRSYRLFEDSGYTPTAAARKDAEDYLVNQYKKTMSEDDALVKANNVLDEIISKPELKSKSGELGEYYSKVRKVNTEILKGKKDIPEPLRAFMGEIKEPTENIVLTVSKMTKLVETSKFFDNLERLGKQGNYIFNEGALRPREGNFVKITGTNSNLDGKYTTPEILTAIKEQESYLKLGSPTGEDNMISNAWRSFLSLKGYSQKAKTVFSHVTHLRNISGGAQFGLANGMNPFNKASGTVKLLANQISKTGQQGLDDIYEKYLRLGIINTNVSVNEFRKLLETGYESAVEGNVDKFFKKMDGYGLGKIQKTGEAVENFYLATDDFYKINGYLSELDTLKKANLGKPDAELEEMAAEIIRNTFPNYDRVPKGIKALRQLPVGSFVSFPSEIIRNSTHIVRQASQEITSGNSVLRNRGLRRLAGFGAASTMWSGLAATSANLLGLTPEEKESLDTITETPWSKDAPRVYARFDDKIFAMDTQFVNSYSILTEPVLAAYNEITSGRLKGEDLGEYLIDSISAGVLKILSPYTDEAILTKSLTDLYVAAKNENGRTGEGKALFQEGLSTWDKVFNGTFHVMNSFLPGSVSSLERVADSIFETPSPSTGSVTPVASEAITNTTGFKFTEVNPRDRLIFAAKEYANSKRNIISDNPSFGTTAEEVISNYYTRENAIYKRAQEFYSVLKSAETIMGRDEALKELISDRSITIGREELLMMTSNRFRPEKITSDDVYRIYQKVKFTDEETLSSLVKNLNNLYSDMIATPLEKPENEREESEYFPRLKRAIGGEVYDVPQAPVEPDERIDKMTGLPYNQQAGGAFVDSEERVGFALGGLGKGLFNIIKTYSKKNISDEAAEAAAKRIESFYTPEELADPKVQEFTQLNARALLDEKHDLTVDQMREQGWEGPIGGDEFSIWRGYTREEIEAFKKANQLADELPFDTQDVTYEITNALDEIQARDIDTPRISAEEEIEADYLERINDALAEGDEDLANELENEMELAVEAFMSDSGAFVPPATAFGTPSAKVVSKLDNALDKLIERGQPIPVQSFENFLIKQGVPKVEIESSRIKDAIEFLGNNLDDAGGRIPKSQISTKGRLTPEILNTIKSARSDKNKFGVREVDMDDIPEVVVPPEEELIQARLDAIENAYKVEMDRAVDNGLVKDYKLGIRNNGEPFLEDVTLTPKGVDEYEGIGFIDDLEEEFETVPEQIDGMLFSEILESWEIPSINYFEPDATKVDFSEITLPDTNLDTYKVRLYNDPRVMGKSTHFRDEGEFSFHTRTDVENGAVRILEIQSDQLNSNIERAEIIKKGKKLRDKPNKTKEEIKELKEFEDMFGDEYIMPVTDFPYVKRGIYGEIQRAYDEGLDRVEIAVDPSGVNDLVRSEEVQQRYETEIPKIAKSIAKDIGTTTKMEDGWLVIDLPDKQIEIPRYNEGGKILKSIFKITANKLKGAGNAVGRGIASNLGIEKSDIEWANSLGMKYGQREEMDGKGDAARHLALGWLAQRSKKPELSKFLINAREVISNVPEREMDQFNNNLGYAMNAKSRAEAEERITKLIDEQQARYMTPAQSQELHGYAKGGYIHPENFKFLESYHDAVVRGDMAGKMDGKDVTMYIRGLGVNGKEYLLPSYDPESGTILSAGGTRKKFKKLIDSGVIKGYDNPKQAEEERRKMYDAIINKRQQRAAGGKIMSACAKRNKRADGGKVMKACAA